MDGRSRAEILRQAVRSIAERCPRNAGTDLSIQVPDVSLARMPDGGPTWVMDDSPTPGWSNVGR